MKRLTEKGITKWLNRIAKAVKQIDGIESYNNDVVLCKQLEHSYRGKDVPYIQLHKGVRKIADILNLEVILFYEDEEAHKECIAFMWDGVMFLQLADKEDRV